MGTIDLALVVGPDRERLGLHLELVLARHLDHPPAEEVQVRARDRLAGPGVGNEVVRLLLSVFLTMTVSSSQATM